MVGPDEAPVLLATVVVIIATLAQIAWLLARGKKVDLMLWVSLGARGRARRRDRLVPQRDLHQVEAERAVLGDGRWRCWVSQLVFGKNLLQALLGAQLELPTPVWQRLNFAWIAFFGADGRAQPVGGLHLLDRHLGQLQAVRRSSA